MLFLTNKKAHFHKNTTSDCIFLTHLVFVINDQNTSKVRTLSEEKLWR